jgi:GrpB-like predicted nucleotidyltransferase (UPF0157 family)/GNAT superfamily N-acetyltransferase
MAERREPEHRGAPVQLHDPDPAWPVRFQAVTEALRSVLTDAATEIHHVGSTAVEGCVAKDCIDVLVELPSNPTAELLGRVERLGYRHEPRFATVLPERWYLHRREPSPVHLHVQRRGLPGAVRDPRLVFRDALRADRSLRDDYVALKRRLVEDGHGSPAYTDAKTAFVFEVLARATSNGDRVGVHLRAEPPESAPARAMVADYVEHLSTTVPGGFDCATDHPPPPGAFEAPRGTFLVMYDDTTPIGCGAAWEMEPGVAEVRRMWVSPTHQGRGLGRRMLAAIESAARALGCRTARLDTMAALGAAVAMYRSHGYHEIADYNANPNADLWFERALDGR